MEELKIGERIFNERKKKNITQEQLGTILGVSAAAVSKWESSISFPDITILPDIGRYFGISMDELFSFSKGLTDEDVMIRYEECEKLMAKGNPEEALSRIENYIKEYPECYFLKFRMGFIMYTYSWKAHDEESGMDMIKRSVELFEDVVKNSNREDIREYTLFQLGAVYPMLGREDEAIEALSKIERKQLEPDDILSSIYIRKKEMKNAREILQRKLYMSFEGIKSSCMGLARSYEIEEDLDNMSRYYNLIGDVVGSISSKGENLFAMGFIRLIIAQAYIKVDKRELAVDEIKKIRKSIKNCDINDIGCYKNEWCFNYMTVGKRTLTVDMNENMLLILKEKIFDAIKDEIEFQLLVKEMEKRLLGTGQRK